MSMRDKMMTISRVLAILSFFTLSKVVYHNYNDIIPDNAILGMAVYVLVLCLMINLFINHNTYHVQSISS